MWSMRGCSPIYLYFFKLPLHRPESEKFKSSTLPKKNQNTMHLTLICFPPRGSLDWNVVPVVFWKWKARCIVHLSPVREEKKNICLLLLRWALLLVYRLMDWKSVKRSMTIWDLFFSLVLNTFWNLFFSPPCWFLWQFSSAIWQQRNTSDYFILPPPFVLIFTPVHHISHFSS